VTEKKKTKTSLGDEIMREIGAMSQYISQVCKKRMKQKSTQRNPFFIQTNSTVSTISPHPILREDTKIPSISRFQAVLSVLLGRIKRWSLSLCSSDLREALCLLDHNVPPPFFLVLGRLPFVLIFLARRLLKSIGLSHHA